jgi:syntaxin 16
MESETDRSFSQSTLQQTAQKHMFTGNDTVIAQREREIEDIAQGIIELANIFQELQTMVIDQGSMLDRIDYNVEKMAVEVKAADKELTVATGYQKRSIKRKAILLLLIVIAGMFILLGLKISSKSSPPPHAPTSVPVIPDPGPAIRLRRGNLANGGGLQSATYTLTKDWRRRKRRPRETWEHLAVR